MGEIRGGFEDNGKRKRKNGKQKEGKV